MATVEVDDRKPVNIVKYATKDFPNFFDSLLRRLKVEYSDVYNDYASTSVGIVLIDLMAYGLSQLSWYLDRRASDTYLDTARTRQAVERLVKQIGYKMRPAAASSTNLTLTFEDGIPGNGSMPAGFRFSGPDGLVFETVADLVLTASGVPVTYTVGVRQGVTRLLTYTSNGKANQSFRLASVPEDKYLADGSVKCFVDGDEWAEVDFLEFEKTDQFEVAYNEVPPLVQFGDGIAGNIPEDKAEVRLQFVVIDGQSGNVKSGTITTAVDTLKIAGEEVSFTVTNESGSVGGTEPETADRARTFAPFSFAARGACITQADYYALSSTFSDPQYGSVAKAYAHVLRGTGQDDFLEALLADLATIVASYVESVEGYEQTIVDETNDIGVEVTNGRVATQNIEDIRTDVLVPQVAATENAALTLKQDGTNIVGDMTTASNILSDMDAQIALIVDPPGAKTELENLSAQMASIISTASGRGSTVVVTSDAITGATKLLSDSISGTDTDDNTVESNTADINTVFDNIGDSQSVLVVTADALSGSASAMKVEVDLKLVELDNYIGTLFDHDCKSNVVQVPILAQLEDGTYVPPSSGLIQSLQTYLDDCKEVTQVVQVIDGSGSLVPVTVDVGVKVLSGFVPDEVLSQVDTVVTGLLTGRDFNSPLTIHDIHTSITENVDGIDKYVNIVMSAVPASYIDSNGNCVPPEQKIITKGSVTVTEI